MVGMIRVSSRYISLGEHKARGLLILDKLLFSVSQMDAAVHVGTAIVLLETDVPLEDIVSDVDTSSTHVEVVFEVRERLDCVRDINCVASEVGHVLREGVALDIDIRLRIGPIGAGVTFEIGRIDMDGTTTRSNILNELVTPYNDRSLIRDDHECTDRLISLNEVGVVESLCGISNGLEHISCFVGGTITLLELNLTR